MLQFDKDVKVEMYIDPNKGYVVKHFELGDPAEGEALASQEVKLLTFTSYSGIIVHFAAQLKPNSLIVFPYWNSGTFTSKTLLERGFMIMLMSLRRLPSLNF